VRSEGYFVNISLIWPFSISEANSQRGVCPDGQRVSRLPRGITIGPDGALYSSGADNVVRYDFQSGRFDRVVVESQDILVQSIIFVPKLSAPCS